MYLLAPCLPDHMVSYYVRNVKTSKETWENLKKIFTEAKTLSTTKFHHTTRYDPQQRHPQNNVIFEYFASIDVRVQDKEDGEGFSRRPFIMFRFIEDCHHDN